MKNITFFKFSLVGKNRGPEDKANLGYKLVRLATSKDNPNLNINEEIISPKESANIFWNLVINEDSSGIEKLGYSKAFGERIIKNMNKSDFNSFKNELNKSGVSLPDDQIQGIISALRSAISKNSANFEEVFKTNNLAQVKVSSTSINMNSIISEAENTTKNEILSSRITNKQKAMDAYAANLIATINKAQVGSASNDLISISTLLSKID